MKHIHIFLRDLVFLSSAERQLLLAYSLVAYVGAIIGTVALAKLQVQSDVPLARGWLAMAGGLGAVGGMRILAGHFGHGGLRGVLAALVAAVLAALVMGVIGGTLVLPAYGTMFGPWLVIAAFLSQPVLLLPWAGAVYVMQKAHGAGARERATLDMFVPRADRYRL